MTRIATVGVLALALGLCAEARAQIAVNTTVAGPQYGPADVAADGTGEFVVVWESRHQDGDQGGIFGQRFDATGARLGGEFQINTNTAGSQEHPKVTSAADGSFVVVWSALGTFGDGISLRRYDAAGVPLAPEALVSATGNFPDVAATAGGAFVVAWGEDDGIMAQWFDGLGVALGPSVAVSTTAYPFGNLPAVAVADDGSATIAWWGYDGGSVDEIRLRRFDASGTPLGPELLLGPGNRRPSVAINGAGELVVAWSISEVFAARFDSDGTPLGSPFQVNTYTTYEQQEPDVALADDGSFVVAWESTAAAPAHAQDGSLAAVIGRRYDAAGAPIGGEFQVNTATSSSQRRASVAGDGGGGFVVTWETYQTGSAEIVAQRFDGAGLPLEPNPIALFKLVVKDPTGNALDRKVKFISKALAIDTTPGTGFDPTVDGASLHLFNIAGTGDSACLSLPAAGWTMAGNPTNPKFLFANPTGALGACKVAAVKDGRLLKVVCDGALQPIPYSLDEASQVGIAGYFASGPVTYCGVWDGASIRADEPGRFVGTRPLESLECPPRPSPCP